MAGFMTPMRERFIPEVFVMEVGEESERGERMLNCSLTEESAIITAGLIFQGMLNGFTAVL